MTIRTTAMRNALAAEYAAQATHSATFTADPGATGTATGETGNRVALSWSAPSNGTVTATAIHSITSGVTVAFVAVVGSDVEGAANVLDTTDVTDQPFNSDGTLTINYSYTQS